MNCSECLEELATGSLRELSPDSAVSRHAASCPGCGPLLTQLRDREYQAATILNNLPPMSNPITVAETAGRLAQRRRMGSVVVTLSSIALGFAIWFAAYTILPDLTGVGSTPATLTETFPLKCLSPQQAGQIVNPYVRSRGTMYYTTDGVAAITVRATPAEMARVREVLRNFDSGRNASCFTGVADALHQAEAALKAAGASARANQAVKEGVNGSNERPEEPERPEATEPREPSAPVLAGSKTTSASKTRFKKK